MIDAIVKWIFAQSWQLAVVFVIVAVVAWTGRRLPARWRYALWALVLMKVFVPPDLESPWGAGHWGGRLLEVKRDAIRSAARRDAVDLAHGEDGQDALPGRRFAATQGGGVRGDTDWRAWCLKTWLAGVGVFVAFVLARYWLLTRELRRTQAVEEGPLRVQYEALGLEVAPGRAPPELLLSPHTSSPFLCGVVHPRIVLPAELPDRLPPGELRCVLLHELIHWRRRDTWAVWLQALVQALFWFHPLVWLAGRQVRHERECACDESAMASDACEAETYGESLLQVLLAARGRSAVTMGFLGVFERQSRIQTRLERIMSYSRKQARGNLAGLLAVGVVVALFYPLAPSRVPAAGGAAGTVETGGQSTRMGPPRIVSTTPPIGATDVDPNLEEITVTFDQDMGSGMSWTGGGVVFPKIPKGAKPRWEKRRTCILPVKLEAGTFYRVGINSGKRYSNFRNTSGTPTETSAIYFTTKGAGDDVEKRVETPVIVSMVPENGAEDVSPSLRELRVTFSVPMGSGHSWTGGGKTFPKITGKPRWIDGGKTCVLPVALEPNSSYRLGINSYSFKKFMSKWGVQVDPVRYTFTTGSR